MTNKMQRFCIEVATNPNQTAKDSAIKSGYSINNASRIANRLMKEPNILTKIEELKAEISADLGITKDYVLRSLKDIADENMVQGKNYSIAIKCLIALGDYLSLWTGKDDPEDHKSFKVMVIGEDGVSRPINEAFKNPCETGDTDKMKSYATDKIISLVNSKNPAVSLRACEHILNFQDPDNPEQDPY